MANQFTDQISNDFSATEKRRIARELIAKCTGKSYDEVSITEVELSAVQSEVFDSLIARVNGGEPLQYVTGLVEFCGLELEVDNRVLIPRPETEEMVQIAKKEIQNRNCRNILDIGSGSGCISLAINKLCNGVKVVGIDVSEGALTVAKLNAARLNADVDFQKVDALNGAIDSTFDMIISNPPYVLESDVKTMQSSVYDHEPNLALFVNDEDPLLFYRAIANRWSKILNPGGVILMEVHQELGVQVASLFNSSNFEKVEVLNDFYGNDRFVLCA